MDKRTGMPADNNLASVTVIAENGAMADAYATALSVMGEEKAIAFQKKTPADSDYFDTQRRYLLPI